MTSDRAKKIAHAFQRIHGFSVLSERRGVYVEYMGKQAYFIREACFWSFILTLGRASHNEDALANIETSLRA